MPGIVGIISQRPAAECEHVLNEMLAVMLHQSHYVCGTLAFPEIGIYGGWVRHAESAEQADHPYLSLLLGGECFIGSQINRNAIFQSYQNAPDRFPEDLNGLFSGLLIDRRARKALLFNDRYGSERIYSHVRDSEFYFASEAKALLRVLPELREFDQEGLAQYLAYGCTTDWRSLFRGIRLLPGGSLFTFEGGRHTARQYFRMETWESLPILSVQSFEKQFKETFEEVLPRYFDSNSGKVGISLTGGLDTRMIVACLPKTIPEPVSYTFTGQTHTTLDDRIAAKVAKALGLNHRLLRLGPNFFSNFPSQVDRTIYVTDGCFGVIGAHEIYFNEQAREMAPVRVTGLVGSEIFRGISTFKPQGLSSELFGPGVASRVVAATTPQQTREHPAAASAFKNVPWHLFGSFAASRSQVTLRTPFLDNDLVALAFQVPQTLRKSPRPALQLVEDNNISLSRIPTDRRIEDKERGFLRRLRWGFYEASFKLDYVYTTGMPPWLSRWDSFLSVLNRGVRIFGHHKFLRYRSWFRHELADYVREILADRRIRENGIWNGRYLEGMMKAHIEGRANHEFEINTVLTIEGIERLLFRDIARQTSPPHYLREKVIASR